MNLRILIFILKYVQLGLKQLTVWAFDLENL